MPRPLPVSEAEFQALMEEVDGILVTQDVPLYMRELAALAEVSRLLGVEQWPMEARLLEPVPDQYSGLSLTSRVIRWINARYGDRLASFDPRPGRMALVLRGQPWIFHFPLFFGKFEMFVSRTEASDGDDVVRDPNRTPRYNILEAIEGLTPALTAALTDVELQYIWEAFHIGLPAYLLMRSLRDQPLVSEAIADHDATVHLLTSPDRNPGQARWSALQAAEKIFKATIHSYGGQPEKTHDLANLASTLVSVGGPAMAPYVGDIQVWPDIRYGGVPTTLQQGVRSHHASLALCLALSTDMRRRLGRSGPLDVTSVRPSH